MTEKIDQGLIIDQMQIPEDALETAFSAYGKCWEITYEILSRNIDGLLTSEYKARLPEGKTTYHKRGEFPNDRYVEKYWDESKKDRLKRALWFPGKEGARERPI